MKPRRRFKDCRSTNRSLLWDLFMTASPHSVRGRPVCGAPQLCPKARAHGDSTINMPYRDFYLNIPKQSLHTENIPWAPILPFNRWQIEWHRKMISLTEHGDGLCSVTVPALWTGTVLFQDLTAGGKVMLTTWEASLCNANAAALTTNLRGQRDSISHTVPTREAGSIRQHLQYIQGST